MAESVSGAMEDICTRIVGQQLPRWNELPDFDLYMDQVLALIAKYLGEYPVYDDKSLTASMVNNYVKMGVMPAPVKKRYSRTHLAHLIVICIMKSALPIASIRQIIRHEVIVDQEETFYNQFCGLYEQINRSVAEAASRVPDAGDSTQAVLKQTLYCAILRAQAERAVAAQTLSVLYAQDSEKESK